MVYTYQRVSFSLKKERHKTPATTYMNLEDIMQSDISQPQTKKDK